jgi:hypothetical protein
MITVHYVKTAWPIVAAKTVRGSIWGSNRPIWCQCPRCPSRGRWCILRGGWWGKMRLQVQPRVPKNIATNQFVMTLAQIVTVYYR